MREEADDTGLSPSVVKEDDVVSGNAQPRPRRRSRRAVLLSALRKSHLYLGLWGAALGLLFGATGIVLNHRSVLKLPVQRAVQSSVQLNIPPHSFERPEDMSAWLQRELQFRPEQITQTKKIAAATVVWADREVMQPERWVISFQSPQLGVTAEYFVGNRFVKLDRLDATPIGTLTRLHMAVGVSAFWVLLSDTVAGSLILLSITGVLLWTQLHTVRTLAVATSMTALLGAVWYLWAG